MKQHEEVIEAIRLLGGIASLREINQQMLLQVQSHWGTKTPFANIRRIVQTRREIHKIKPGLYCLSVEKDRYASLYDLPEKGEGNKAALNLNHYYYQGILLEIGQAKCWKTYVPSQDKNRKFINTPLKELCDYEELPAFGYSSLMKKAKSIDVIWFNDREMPSSAFEVEISTDIYRSLMKFHSLQDFHMHMAIVAPAARKREFDSKIAEPIFQDIRNRVAFLDLDKVGERYERSLKASIIP